MTCQSYSLVQENFAMILPFFSSFAKTSDTVTVRLRTLKEAAIATDRVANTILCRAVELWPSRQCLFDDHMTEVNQPSEAKMMGLSVLDGLRKVSRILIQTRKSVHTLSSKRPPPNLH
jgi:hypothetical protein